MTGLVGGTFDPVHFGHLDIARAAQRALPLDRLLFIPAHIPPHRSAPQASGADRLAMLKLAIAGESDFETSTIELDAPGPSYTSITIDSIIGKGIPGTDLCFVTGADAFAGIERWHNYPQLLDRCHFAVVSRPDMPASALRTAIPSLAPRMIDVSVKHTYKKPAQPSIFLIDALTTAVSSTDVRACIDRDTSLAGLVPDVVAAYIDVHKLYQREAHGH